jgi:hypothetical protein
VVLASLSAAVYGDEADWKSLLTPIEIAQDTAIRIASYERLEGPHDGGAVLVAGPQGSFDSWGVCTPHVHYDGNIFRMWYSGGSVPPHYHGEYAAIGLATSTDGIHWERANGGKPVLVPGPAGAFDEAQLLGPCLLYENGLWRMWYCALMTPRNPKPEHWQGRFPADWDPRIRIGLATSRDGINWERQNDGNPVLDLGPIGSTDELQVMHPTVVRAADDSYRMWYAANAFVVPHTVAMATSPDGVAWTKYRGGEPVRGLGWYVTGPAVVRIGDEYLMLCSPEDLELNQWIVRAAVSRDGFNWHVLNQGKSVALPGTDLQFEGQVPAEEGSTHHPTSAVRVGNELWFWYAETNVAGKGFRIAGGKIKVESVDP